MSRFRVPRPLAPLRKNSSTPKNSSSSGVLSRVAQLNDILHNEHISSTEKSLQCQAFYRAKVHPKVAQLEYAGAASRHNFISDLSRDRDLNSGVIQSLCGLYARNSSMKAFFLQQIMANIEQRNFNAVLSAFEMMDSGRLLSAAQRTQVNRLHKQKSQLKTASGADVADAEHDCLQTASDLLLSVCISSGESLLAVVLAEACHDTFPQYHYTIKPAVLEAILVSLSIHDPVMSHYKAFAIFRMLELFARDVVPISTHFKMLSNMSSNVKNPFFANMLFDRVKTDPRYVLSDLGETDLELFLSALRTLIAHNIHHKNAYRAAWLWSLIYESPSIKTRFIDQNSVLLEATLYEISALEAHGCLHTVIKLLEGVDLKQHGNLLDFALQFYGKHALGRFESLVKMLEPPLARSTLSSLFCGLLNSDSETAAEKTMQAIFRTNRGLNSGDLENIVIKLLGQNKYIECIDMGRETNFQVAGKAMVHVMMYLLKRKLRIPALPEEKALEKQIFLENYGNFVDMFSKRLQRASDLWLHFSLFLIRFISQHISVRVSRRIYEVKAFEKSAGSGKLDLELLGIPSVFEQFVCIDVSNRIPCLLEIMSQAHRINDRTIISWCAEELHFLGVPVADIERFYTWERSLH